MKTLLKIIEYCRDDQAKRIVKEYWSSSRENGIMKRNKIPADKNDAPDLLLHLQNTITTKLR
jgi:hypothetical protein